MTIEKAIRLLDPYTTQEEINKIRRDNVSLSEQETYNIVIDEIEEACKLACEIMRDYLERKGDVE